MKYHEKYGEPILVIAFLSAADKRKDGLVDEKWRSLHSLTLSLH